MEDIVNKPPLCLAFLGDSYWALMVKEHFVLNSNCKINELHKKANSMICASFQAKVFDLIKPTLNESEQDIARRARNVPTTNVPKSASLEEYKKSTSLEALIGYWFLVGDNEKCNNTFQRALLIK